LNPFEILNEKPCIGQNDDQDNGTMPSLEDYLNSDEGIYSFQKKLHLMPSVNFDSQASGVFSPENAERPRESLSCRFLPVQAKGGLVLNLYE
jgi:hypothetical protein